MKTQVESLLHTGVCKGGLTCHSPPLFSPLMSFLKLPKPKLQSDLTLHLNSKKKAYPCVMYSNFLSGWPSSSHQSSLTMYSTYIFCPIFPNHKYLMYFYGYMNNSVVVLKIGSSLTDRLSLISESVLSQ